MIHISALLLPMKTSHVALSQSNMAVKAVSDWETLHCSRASSSLNVRLSLPETKPETNALLYKIMSCPQLSPKGQSKVSITASSWHTDAPHFLALCFIALSQIFLFFFLQIEHLWQCCLKQVCWYHFSMHLLHWQAGSLPLAPPGNPWGNFTVRQECFSFLKQMDLS